MWWWEGKKWSLLVWDTHTNTHTHPLTHANTHTHTLRERESVRVQECVCWRSVFSILRRFLLNSESPTMHHRKVNNWECSNAHTRLRALSLSLSMPLLKLRHSHTHTYTRTTSRPLILSRRHTSENLLETRKRERERDKNFLVLSFTFYIRDLLSNDHLGERNEKGLNVIKVNGSFKNEDLVAPKSCLLGNRDEKKALKYNLMCIFSIQSNDPILKRHTPVPIHQIRERDIQFIEWPIHRIHDCF